MHINQTADFRFLKGEVSIRTVMHVLMVNGKDMTGQNNKHKK